MHTKRVALLAIFAAVAVTAAIATTASAAQRYASPTGSGSACTAAQPCTIGEAVEGVDPYVQNEVIVASGEYDLTKTLETTYPMTIHGVAGQPRPRLRFKGQGQQGLRVLNSTLRYVEVEQAGDWGAVYASSNALVDQVIVKSSGSAPTASIRASMIRNSIVVQSNPLGGVALETAANGASAISTYRNVTAIAPNVMRSRRMRSPTPRRSSRET